MRTGRRSQRIEEGHGTTTPAIFTKIWAGRLNAYGTDRLNNGGGGGLGKVLTGRGQDGPD